jgi:Cupin-like domain
VDLNIKMLIVLLFFVYLTLVYSQRNQVVNLFQASRKGDVDLVKQLIREVDVNSVFRGETALVALLQGWYNAVNNYSPSKLDEDKKFSQLMEFLITSGGAWAGLQCPLLEAIGNRNLPALDLLVRHMNSSEVNFCLAATDTRNQNVFHHAVFTPSSGFARFLYRSFNTSVNLDSHLANLGLTSNVNALWDMQKQYLYKSKIENSLSLVPLKSLFKLLHSELSQMQGDSSMMQDYLAHTINLLDQHHQTPVTYACKHGLANVVELLLLAGADPFLTGPKSNNFTCAHFAVSYGYTSVLDVLFDRVPDLFTLKDSFDRTPAEISRSHVLKRELGDWFKARNFTVPTWLNSKRRVHNTREFLALFNRSKHVELGWAIASESELARFLPSSVSTPIDVVPGKVLDSKEGILQLKKHFFSLSKPFLIENGMSHIFSEGAQTTRVVTPMSKKSILHKFGNLSVAVGTIPYQDSYSEDGTNTKMKVRDFVREFMKSNQSLVRAAPYVFDGFAMQMNPSLFSSFFPLHPVFDKGMPGLKQFILGGVGSGSMMHFHGSAVNLLMVGLKLWVLVPPPLAFFARENAFNWFNSSYERDFLQCTHVSVHPTSPSDASTNQCTRHISFLQRAGDIVYIPEHWGHSVLNLADSVAVAIE